MWPVVVVVVVIIVVVVVVAVDVIVVVAVIVFVFHDMCLLRGKCLSRNRGQSNPRIVPISWTSDRADYCCRCCCSCCYCCRFCTVLAVIDPLRRGGSAECTALFRRCYTVLYCSIGTRSRIA